jgi:hypothetical protein
MGAGRAAEALLRFPQGAKEDRRPLRGVERRGRPGVERVVVELERSRVVEAKDLVANQIAEVVAAEHRDDHQIGLQPLDLLVHAEGDLVGAEDATPAFTTSMSTPRRRLRPFSSCCAKPSSGLT